VSSTSASSVVAKSTVGGVASRKVMTTSSVTALFAVSVAVTVSVMVALVPASKSG